MKYYWFCLFSVLGSYIGAQTYHGASFLYDVNSLTQSNPGAYQAEDKFTVFLPELFGGYSNSGPRFNEMFSENEQGKYVFDKVNSLENVDDINNLHGAIFLQTLGIAYAFNHLSLSFGHAIRGIGYGSYTEELLHTYVQGNAEYIGEQIDIGPQLLLQNFHQYSLGISYHIDKVGFGIRGKYLSGIQDISTKRSILQLTTGDTFYDLQFNNDLLYNTSSIFRYEDLSNVEFNVDSNIWKRFFSSNRGLAIDLGVEYEVSNTVLVSAALYDVGKITWSRDVRNYASDTTYTYTGIDLVEIIDIDNQYELSDTLNNLLQLSETYDGYSTVLPSQVELGVKVFVNESISINANVNYLNVQERSFWSIAGAIHYRPMENVKLSMSGGYINDHALTLGVGANLKIGPFTYFINTNNLMGMMRPLDRAFANLHTGASLSF